MRAPADRWSVTPVRRGRVAALYALLIATNVAVWLWAVLLFRGQPALLGTALLAYGLGLRHAVDADHIAAIDNVTRKLMSAGKRPIAVGLFFALGHSAVVVLASVGVALGATALGTGLDRFRAVGSVVGTTVSALFLFTIAAVNLLVLRSVWYDWRRNRAGGGMANLDSTTRQPPGGVLTRLLRPALRLVTTSWHMLPLGFLFGLGFDTATEVALLGISAAQAAQGLSVWSILVFPALFAAGMALVDTTDGVLMLRAFEWAYAEPVRRLRYNLAVTLVSATVAVLVGGVEAIGLLGDGLGLSGPFWDGVGAINDNLTAVGLVIIGLFVALWTVSALLGRGGGTAASADARGRP